MTDNKIIICSERKTTRMVYIFNLILKNMLGLNPEFISDKNDIKEKNIPIISYGFNCDEASFFIAADDLLFERGIKEIPLNFSTYNDLPCFFPTYNKKSVYNFDLFAASFYLVSRYEEYLPFIKDRYGRFDANQSIAFQKGFLNKPLVNIWVLDLEKKLREKFPDLEFTKSEFKYIPTIDIDAVFAYKHKGFWRTIGGYLKNVRDHKWKEIIERTQVFTGKREDPFDSFDYIFQLHKSHKLKPIFFVLFADYGTNDKNLPIYNRKFQSVARRLIDYGHVGIHPSYTSNSIIGKAEKEITALSKVIHSEITKSRQHFLMLSMPESYNRLIDNGITEDYTMGYASQPGFRASICSPYYFYNLEFEMVTSLKIFPFSYMEGTLRDYMQLSPNEAKQIIFDLIDEVKTVNGNFISIWHNESLGGENRWKGWPDIYEASLNYALTNEKD